MQCAAYDKLSDENLTDYVDKVISGAINIVGISFHDSQITDRPSPIPARHDFKHQNSGCQVNPVDEESSTTVSTELSAEKVIEVERHTTSGEPLFEENIPADEQSLPIVGPIRAETAAGDTGEMDSNHTLRAAISERGDPHDCDIDLPAPGTAQRLVRGNAHALCSVHVGENLNENLRVPRDDSGFDDLGSENVAVRGSLSDGHCNYTGSFHDSSKQNSTTIENVSAASAFNSSLVNLFNLDTSTSSTTSLSHLYGTVSSPERDTSCSNVDISIGSPVSSCTLSLSQDGSSPTCLDQARRLADYKTGYESRERSEVLVTQDDLFKTVRRQTLDLQGKSPSLPATSPRQLIELEFPSRIEKPTGGDLSGDNNKALQNADSVVVEKKGRNIPVSEYSPRSPRHLAYTEDDGTIFESEKKHNLLNILKNIANQVKMLEESREEDIERAVERGRAESQSHLVSMRETLEKQMDNLKSAWMDRDNMAEYVRARELEWSSLSEALHSEVTSVRKQLTHQLSTHAKSSRVSRYVRGKLLQSRYDLDSALVSTIQRQSKVTELKLTVLSQQQYITRLEQKLSEIQCQEQLDKVTPEQCQSEVCHTCCDPEEAPTIQSSGVDQVLPTEVSTMTDVLLCDRVGHSPEGPAVNLELETAKMFFKGCDDLQTEISQLNGVFNNLDIPYTKKAIPFTSMTSDELTEMIQNIEKQTTA